MRAHGRTQRGRRMLEIRVRTSNIRASPKFIHSRDTLAPRPLAPGRPLGPGVYELCHPGSRSLEDRGAASRCGNHAKEAETRGSFLCEMMKRQSLTGETGVCQGPAQTGQRAWAWAHSGGCPPETTGHQGKELKGDEAGEQARGRAR